MAEIWINNPFDNLPAEGAKPQRYAFLSAELVRQGHSVTWWSASFSHSHKAPRQTPEGSLLPSRFSTSDGYTIRLLPTLPYSSNICLRRIMSHRAYAKTWLQTAMHEITIGQILPPDIILLSSPPLSTFQTAKTLREKVHCKLVLDIMDAWPEAFETLLPNGLRRFVSPILFAPLRILAQRNYRNADFLTATSNQYVDLARKYGATTPAKAFYHTTQIPQPNPQLDSSSIPLQDKSTTRLVYVGNMGRFYDLKTLIQTVAKLSEQGHAISLDLAGSGPSEATLRSMSANCPAIRFHGFLNASALTNLLHSAHIGIIPILPSSSVAIPYKLPDYAAHRLAILSSLTGECNKLITNHHAGMTYYACNPNSLATAILALHKNPNRLAEMRENALSLAQTHFSPDTIYPAFAKFLAPQ